MAALVDLYGADLASMFPVRATRPRVGRVASTGRLNAEEDTTKRREFNRLSILTLVGALVGSVDLDRIASAGSHHPVDSATLRDLALVTDSYARQWKVLPPATLLPGVHAHLRLLASIRAHQDRTLRALTADTAVLAGYLAFQVEDRGRAASYWTLSRELGVEVGGETWGRVQIALSALPSQLAHGVREGSRTSIDLLDGALRSAGPGASRLLRAWGLARRAEEHAALGHAPAADRDIEAADACLSASAPCSDAIIGPRDSSQLDGFHGQCAVLLCRNAEAAGILRRCLHSMPADMVAWRSVVHCDLVAALAGHGEVDEACGALARAFTLAQEIGATEHVQRVHGIRRRLELHSDSGAVRRLDELLTGAL